MTKALTRTGQAILVAAALGTAVIAAPSAANADPVVPCGYRSTKVNNYFNVTHKNCSPDGYSRGPYSPGGLGRQGACKFVAPGAWVSWTRLPMPAIGGYETVGC